MNINGCKNRYAEYPIEYYRNFLLYIQDRYKDQYWKVTTKEFALFWKKIYLIKNKNQVELKI